MNKKINTEENEIERIPQGAFGVDEMDLYQLQDEIHALEQEEATSETNSKFNQTLNRLNSRSPYIKFLAGVTVIWVALAFFISYTIDFDQVDLSNTLLSFISTVFTKDLLLFIGIGIVTQLLDGILGMGYGVACSSFLLGLGLTPAYTSATVHIAKSFNTGASGILHLRFRSLNQKLFRSLLIPGIAGSVLGAWLLSAILNNDIIKPFIALYLLLLGVLILLKPFRKPQEKRRVKLISWLAVLGGFIDSIGGGGWGPIVTSNLLQKGRVTTLTVGSVNIVEFFVAMSAAVTFIYFGNFSGWQAILGLIIGGIIAYPFTSLAASKINRTAVSVLLGSIVIFFSIDTFISADYKIVSEYFNHFFSMVFLFNSYV